MKGRFSVIRYVTDPVRNEPINIGVVLQCGESIDVRVRNDAIRRAMTSDPQADEAALTRIESYVKQLTAEPKMMVDPIEGISRLVPPPDANYLVALAREGAGKIIFTEPSFIEVQSPDEQARSSVVEMLAYRLVRPLRQRPVFAPIESPPRRTMRRALRPWIEAGTVLAGYAMQGQSGLQRVADFYFRNGFHYPVKHVELDYRREAQLFGKAEAEAFEIEDVRRGNPDRAWKPVVVCEFSTDRVEDWVWQVKNIFKVVECEAFDANRELSDAIEHVQQNLPTLH